MSNALVALLLVGYAASASSPASASSAPAASASSTRNLKLVDEVAITMIADSHAQREPRECLKEIGADVDSVAVHTEYTELLASPDVDAVVARPMITTSRS